MTSRDAFKAGFMMACGEKGLAGHEVKTLMAKAATLLDKRAFLDGVGDAVKSVGIGLPIVAGAGAGYIAHRIAGSDVDDEDVKTQEMINELRQYARRAKEQQKSKQLRASLGL